MIASVSLLCLALNVYHESRSESPRGQLLVAQTTMNRAQQDPKRVCPVVTAHYQFSWTIDCLTPARGGYRLQQACFPHESSAWWRAVDAAQRALQGKTKRLTCADHYARFELRPRWSKRMRVESRTGHHRFYISAKQAKFCA